LITWINPDHPEEEINDWVQEELGIPVHPAAIKHLKSSINDKTIPFPRLEKHEDYSLLENHEGYLFGIVYLPSNTTNPAAEFDVIVFLATHNHVVASIITRKDTDLEWGEIKTRIEDVNTDDTTSDGGQFILNLFSETVRLLLDDAKNIKKGIDDLLKSKENTPSEGYASLKELGQLSLPELLLENPKEISKKRRAILLNKLNKLATPFSIVTGEMNQMMRVAVETESILFKLSTDDEALDLKKDQDGKERELFSKDLEIYMADSWEQCRILVATLEEIKSLIKAVDNLTSHLSDEENAAAGRFTGAIASIMLLPTFIVGLYGQNFVSMPETDWAHGYLFSWGAIVFLTVVQILYFRHKKWI